MTDIELFETDYVQFEQDGSFVKFSDGQIAIWGDKKEAEEDDNSGNCRTVSCVELTENKKQELIDNIRRFA
jgi:hypothetical protein